MTAAARVLLQLLRALLTILRTMTGHQPERPSSANPWLATKPPRNDAEWALAIELQAAEHTTRRRALETHRDA